MSIRKSSLRPPNRAWKTWSSQTGQTDRYGICSASTLHLFGPGSQLTISNSNAMNIRVFRLKKTVICKVSNKIQAEKVRFYKHATTRTLRRHRTLQARQQNTMNAELVSVAVKQTTSLLYTWNSDSLDVFWSVVVDEKVDGNRLAVIILLFITCTRHTQTIPVIISSICSSVTRSQLSVVVGSGTSLSLLTINYVSEWTRAGHTRQATNRRCHASIGRFKGRQGAMPPSPRRCRKSPFFHVKIANSATWRTFGYIYLTHND